MPNVGLSTPNLFGPDCLCQSLQVLAFYPTDFQSSCYRVTAARMVVKRTVAHQTQITMLIINSYHQYFQVSVILRSIPWTEPFQGFCLRWFLKYIFQRKDILCKQQIFDTSIISIYTSRLWDIMVWFVRRTAVTVNKLVLCGTHSFVFSIIL